MSIDYKEGDVIVSLHSNQCSMPEQHDIFDDYEEISPWTDF